MSKLLVLNGLPASGKSTYAKELVTKGWKRVNKDELRDMIDCGIWSRANEGNILGSEKILTIEFLRQGLDVVVDDTNFAHTECWQRVAKDMEAEFEIKFFDTPLMECIERDAKRGEKSVGAKVIYKMYNQYLKPEPLEFSDDKQNCYIFDIDGTLAKMVDRNPYDYTKVHSDIPNHNIAMLARILSQSGLPIIVISGRTDDCIHETEEWLHNNFIPYQDILMRKTGDMRSDAIVKREIYERELKDKYNILAVFDDRDRVVQMWRSLGLTCCQVDYGMF